MNEWQATTSGKQPWYSSPRTVDGSGPLFAFAELFEAWRTPEAPPENEWLPTCCIITTKANALMTPIHDPIPVILAREHWDAWLSREQQDVAALATLLAPTGPARLQAWPVSRSVSRSSSDGEMLIEPVAEND